MDNNDLVMAGIVTFNPDITLLKNNIEAIIKLLNVVCIVDNGSTNIDDIENLIDGLSKEESKEIILQKFEKNLGIAAALNQIMLSGKKLGYRWVLTLDQDSVAPNNIIDSNWKLMQESKDVAIISAVIMDRNVQHKKAKRDNSKPYSEVENCITSSSLTSVEIWESIGKFDEYMFIDEVDIEYCLRARKKGFRILRNNDVILSHAIGNIKEVNFFGKWITIRNHSAFRKYYQIRNLFYMSKKIYNRILPSVWLRTATAYFKVIFFEKDRKKKLKEMNRGLVDGLKV